MSKRWQKQYPGDAADKAGIQAKDIIIEVNGKKVTSSRDLINLAANLSVGDTAKVTVLRNGQQKTFDVVTGKRPLTMAAAPGSYQKEKENEYGFQVTDLTPDMARRLNIKQTKGVVVVGVVPKSKAEAAGIERGDLIIEVNHENAVSASDFKKLVHQRKKGGTIDLLVKRMNAGLIVIHLA